MMHAWETFERRPRCDDVGEAGGMGVRPRVWFKREWMDGKAQC